MGRILNSWFRDFFFVCFFALVWTASCSAKFLCLEGGYLERNWLAEKYAGEIILFLKATVWKNVGDHMRLTQKLYYLVRNYYKDYRKEAEESYLQMKWQKLFRVDWMFYQCANLSKIWIDLLEVCVNLWRFWRSVCLWEYFVNLSALLMSFPQYVCSHCTHETVTWLRTRMLIPVDSGRGCGNIFPTEPQAVWL